MKNTDSWQLVKQDAHVTWDFDRRLVVLRRTLWTTHTEEEKVSLHEVIGEVEPNKVDQPVRARRLAHQRNTQTNSSLLVASQAS
jgi:hypothetical protein